MSQNQEIIESKLCAYIDGELDADGRTEIEKHLDANPQHRRLLESLKATRDLIKWLPREAAPPELAETLNGQLERSVLLDFDERSLNRNIGPRVLTAAAIILLTAGLGAAVYFTLPKSQKAATPYVLRSGDSQSPMPDGTMPEAATEPGKPEDALVASAPMAAKAAAPTPMLMAKQSDERTPNPELDRLATDVSQNQAAILAVANRPTLSLNAQQQQRPMASNAIVMLVHADSTEQATHDVTTYLESQNIQWKSAPAAAATEPPTSQIGAFAESNRDALRENVLNRSARRAMQAEPTTRPDSPSNSLASLNQSQVSQSQTNLSPAAGVYVARMSRQQAINLNNSVQQGRSQKSELKDLNAAAGAGNSLFPAQYSQGQNSLGQNSQNQIVQDRSAQIQNSQSQNGQGSYAAAAKMMPSPAPAPSSGPTTDATADQAASRFGGGVFGGGGGAGGGGRGGFGGAAGRPASATEPASQGAISQPATSEPADAPVDVVIVVQPDVIMPSTQAAQTEPAATQPAVSATQPAPQTQPAAN